MQKFYFGYVDFENPIWFKCMCEGLFQIIKMKWIKNNTFYGLSHTGRLDNIIYKIKKRNKRILLKYNDNVRSARFDIWIDGRKQKVPVLEVWRSEKQI